MMHPRDWTLATKLLASVVALFITVTVAIGGATVLVMRHVLVSQLDDQLHQVAFGDNPNQDQRDRGRPLGSCFRAPPNAGDGFINLCLSDTAVLSQYRVTKGDVVGLDAAAIATLRAVPVSAEPRTVDLGDELGEYRVVAARATTATVAATVVSGKPMSLTKNAVATLIRNILLFSVLGLVLVWLAGTWLIRANLRPLQRVAATAARVSRLPLSSGEVELAERVEPTDTNHRTEVGKVGAALNELLDHVDRSLSARHASEMRLRQFVADASHELRTPLASIKGYAELTRREREPVPAGVTHAITRIESESTRMASLVDDLLLLARLDAGRPLEREPVDITRLVIDAVSDLRAAGPDHLWRLDLPEESVEVVGDRARLTQVVVNLLNNARVHTPQGSTVTARVRPASSGVVIEVADDGPGIPAELLPNVFARFTRGDSARVRNGGSTGLGLSIVQAVTAAHGGDVSVNSQPGRTVFTVRLPADGDLAAHPPS